MIDPPPPLGGGTELRGTAVPVIVRPLLGRLFSGTARRGASPELADAPDERDPDDAVDSEPPRGAPPLPSRETARLPVLEPLLLLRRPPCPASLARCGASKLFHVAGVGDEPPLTVPPDDPDDPLEEELPELLEPDDPLSPPPPRETEPPPPLSPRETDEPVVLPFDVRSWAEARPAIDTVVATVSAVRNLFLISTPLYLSASG